MPADPGCTFCIVIARGEEEINGELPNIAALASPAAACHSAAAVAIGATGALVGCAPQGDDKASDAAALAEDEGACGCPSQCRNMCFNAWHSFSHVVDGKFVEIKGDDCSPAGCAAICAARARRHHAVSRRGISITKPMKRNYPQKGASTTRWEEIS